MIKQMMMACLVAAGMMAATGAEAQERDGKKHKDKGEMFKQMDTDGDGKISRAEADKGEKGKLKEKFAMIDTDNDGFLTKEEMKAFREKKKEERKK